MTRFLCRAAFVWAIVLAASCSTDSDEALSPTSSNDGGSLSDATIIRSKDAADSDAPVQEAVLQIPDKRVGILFLTWDTPAAQAAMRLQGTGAVPTVEEVIRSNGAMKVSDMLAARGEYTNAAAFHYHVRPQAGIHCLFRKRPGDTATTTQDCPDISAHAKRHADLLIQAGVDHVLADATNLPVLDSFSDLIQLRPTEVLFEEWSALRRKGVLTPQIAVWGNAAANANIHREYLKNIYNNAAFDNVIMRDKKSGKKVYFLVDGGAQAIFDEIASNGGRNDILPVWMWGNMEASRYQNGVFSFMSPCVDGTDYTTNVVGRPCTQRSTTGSALGTQLAVSLSYQVNFASVPFGAPGKLGGATFRKQFTNALAIHPDYLFVNGWNEFIAQPQPNPGYAPSMGLEVEPPGDALYGRLWVDAYGAEFDRAFEPNDVDGDQYYKLLASCLRVYRTGSTTCNNPSEACCSTEEPYVTVYSLAHPNGEHVLTASETERSALKAGGWAELCNPAEGPANFCIRREERGGPFLLYRAGGTGRVALNRCIVNGSATHFMSTSPTCEGQTVEGPLGFLSTIKTSATPRSFRRCLAGVHSHALADGCPPGTSDDGVFGYVR